MTGYARPIRNSARPDTTWADIGLYDLDGQELTDWAPSSDWVEAVCFDGMHTGLYVLTQDEDSYFTANSCDLDFEVEIPEGQTGPGQQTTNGDNMKTETTSRPAGFMRMQETVVTRYPSVKWLSGSELTDTEKDYLATGQWDSAIVATCAHGYNVIEISGTYLAVIASEDCL